MDSGAGMLVTLIKSPKEILATEKAANHFKAPGRLSNKWKPRDMNRFCDFHNDFGHDTDECFNLKTTIEEAVRSGKLSHLIKGIRNPKKERVEEPLDEEKKPQKDKVIFTIDSYQPYKKRGSSYGITGYEEIFFPALDTIIPSDLPVTISGRIYNRRVHRIYLDGGSACDVMYEHCFTQLNLAIRTRIPSARDPLIGFSGEKCWPIREIKLELTIGEPPYSRTKTLKLAIIRSASPHNILLERVAMRKMGMIVSTIHQLVKFHTSEGIGMLAYTYDGEKVLQSIRLSMEEPRGCIMELSRGRIPIGKTAFNFVSREERKAGE
ncbi:uncharacterized protein [Rutidosis leptorrhynchoides]|uniref:uncharacterized protein n=1 Tax=Rutidosis leptorrhynchoides TaxID=125765 RepID=UPI003A99AEAB